MGLGEHPKRIIVSRSWSMGAIDARPSELPPAATAVAVEVMRKTNWAEVRLQAWPAGRPESCRECWQCAVRARWGRQSPQTREEAGLSLQWEGVPQFHGQRIGLIINLPLFGFHSCQIT